MANGSPDSALLLMMLVIVGLLTRYVSLYRAYTRQEVGVTVEKGHRSP